MARLFPSIPPRWQWAVKRSLQSVRRSWRPSSPSVAPLPTLGDRPTTIRLLTHHQHGQDYSDSRQNQSDSHQKKSGDRSTIVIRHLHHVFRPDHAHPCPALTNVSLTIEQGTVQMIMGPSGAGKTTLLLCLAGLLQPTNGIITMFGQCLNDLSLGQLEHFRRQQIGMVFQESNLLRSLTALENVEAMLQFRGIPRHAAHRQAQDLLDAVGLHTHWQHLPRQLSGGQQQRVSIARALAGYPPLILADEPTAALDSKTGHKVVEFMHHMAKDHGCTVIITTHDTRILDLSDRIYHLHDGQIQTGQPYDGLPQAGSLATSPLPKVRR